MRPDLRGVRVAVVGGDARELILAKHLAQLGAQVLVMGLPVDNCGVVYCSGNEELHDVDAVILPVPGITEHGVIYSAFPEQPPIAAEQVLSRLPSGIPVFVGVARSLLKEIASRRGLRLIEVLNLDEVAILNSIPSAEGAIQMAMEHLPITIHGSRALVLGFGRTGMTLARMLKALNAHVSVAARRPAHLARIEEMGMCPLTYEELPQAVEGVDVIFNTVPALILTGKLLERISPSTLIIDLASAPGGTDFVGARRRGIKAILAPGLPGKVAPQTAGQILARVIPRLLAQEVAR